LRQGSWLAAVFWSSAGRMKNGGRRFSRHDLTRTIFSRQISPSLALQWRL
jgi:hypothetical protein